MERKLATVLFVDIVDSTRLVTGADPEVVRRRVSQFFEMVSKCVTMHGGVVEKFAGDAVLAAFGVPRAHEDDARRAARAALAMQESVGTLGLQARVGIEAGEIVVDSTESTFATGEAVNIAARLQQAARPGEILLGPTAHRLAVASLVTEDAGPVELKGLDGALRARRLLDVLDTPGRPPGPRAPLVGREAELELFENTLSRAVRDGRAHLLTIYGEPGIGKSRLAREFLDGVERASTLMGRALPYGEGVTYWPLAEMVKAAAGISDDDPLEEAFEKLRECCAEEAVAHVLALASGLLEALEGERSQEEMAWAAGELFEQLADVQPLILLFEDIHWAEAPLLDLIEHIAHRVRAPLLIVCLARPELLDRRPDWGGGRVRSTSIELDPLSEVESRALVEKLLELLAGTALEIPAMLPEEVLERAEGNPLFVEETVRMLVERASGDGAPDGVPDTLQALIAARIDQLHPSAKALLQRASVIGRVFWQGALEYVSPDLEDSHALLEDLLQREFVLREQRSSISGETAYRFKHLLIREVAYGGLAKLARAQYHARFADWLKERTGKELVEIRAYHLDHSVGLLVELEGAAPEELVHEAADALVAAARRTMARESYANARKLGLRALELRPMLGARFVAARAAWRLQDWAAVGVEMEKVREQAHAHGERVVEALALTALGEASIKRTGDVAHAKELVDEALEILAHEDDPVAHFDALGVRAAVGAWQGSEKDVVRFVERAYAIALDAGRKDLQTIAATSLARTHVIRLELEEAELILLRALELAGESGSVRARVSATETYGWYLTVKGELDAAERVLEEVRSTAAELGIEPAVAASLLHLGWIARLRGDHEHAEKLLREALHITSRRGDRGTLPDFQAVLATTLADLGKVDEAEPLALEALANGSPDDTSCKIASITALAAVRMGQGRDDEADELFRSAVTLARDEGFAVYEIEPLERYVSFLRTRRREEEAEPYEARLAELSPRASRTARIA